MREGVVTLIHFCLLLTDGCCLLSCYWVGGNQPIHINICINAISIVPSGDKTDVLIKYTDVRLVGFHPLLVYKQVTWHHNIF
jgi:hypothetical protein